MAWYRDRFCVRELAILCSIAILPGNVFVYGQQPPAGNAAGSQQAQPISPQQLDSLVSPIALYPDTLLAQVLAASTYPLEVVTASRWVQQNSSLTGKALMEAAGKQDWDPSIQALVVFPSVLQMLNQNLDWTTALGNAFLAQQPDVMAAVQRMRWKAKESGKLQSTSQQMVETSTVEGQPTIEIQPANPEVVYVPSYDPAAVYGAAPEYYPYPAISYPSYPWGAGAIAFGTGVAIGAIFGGCCGPGWGWGWGVNWGRHPSLYVNNHFFNSNRNAFVRRNDWGHAYAGSGRAAWDHNPRYRGAVPYTNRNVANRYNGGRAGSMRPAQLPANTGNIRPPAAQGGASRLPGNIGQPGGQFGRGGASQLPANIGNRPGNMGRNRPANIGGNRPAQLPSPAGSANRVAPGGGQWGGWSGGGAAHRGGAFSGGSAFQSHQFSNRGFQSMRGGSFGGGGFRGGGGGFRGGGGGFRGGGRRR